MINPKDHALFKRYPLHGTAQLSTGEVPMPYHIYRGYGLFIGGTASLPTDIAHPAYRALGFMPQFVQYMVSIFAADG